MTEFISIEEERELFEAGYINLAAIQNKVRAFEDDDYDDGSIDAKVVDDFQRYVNHCKFFSTQIFNIDENKQEISFNPKFLATNEYSLFLKLHQLNCNQKTNATPDQEKVRIECEQKRQLLTSIFEKIVGEALVALFDNKSAEYLISDCNSNENFSIKHLSNKTGWEFRSEFRKKPINQADGKCDIVFWKSLDELPGEIILLIQCKTGRNWRDGGAVDMELWWRKIGFPTQPIKCYAITDILTSKEQHSNALETHGLILDKKRILNLLSNHNNPSIKEIRNEISLQIN